MEPPLTPSRFTSSSELDYSSTLRENILPRISSIFVYVNNKRPPLIVSSLLNSSSDSNSDSLDSLLATYEVSCSTPLVFDLLVQGYAKLRLLESGFDVFQSLCDRGFSLSVISLNTLLHFAAKSNRIDLVWRIYKLAIHKRIYPNETTIQIMISALCKEGKLKDVVGLLDMIDGKRCLPPVIVNTSLVFRVLESNRIEQGISLLKRLLQKNMVIDTIEIRKRRRKLEVL